MRIRMFVGAVVAVLMAVTSTGLAGSSGQDRKTCCEKRLLCCARSLACCPVRVPKSNSCCVQGNQCCNNYPSACCKPKAKK